MEHSLWTYLGVEFVLGIKCLYRDQVLLEDCDVRLKERVAETLRVEKQRIYRVVKGEWGRPRGGEGRREGRFRRR
jgi:hypothetical protein